MIKYLFNSNKSIEQEEDDDIVDEENHTIFNEPLGTYQWGKECYVSYHVKDIRSIAPYLSSWCYNRVLDDNHKNQIKEALNIENPYLLGSIQVVRDRSKNVRVINGQHRLKAFQEKITEDIEMTFNMKLMFEVIDVPLNNINDIDEDSSVIDSLFKKANYSLALNPDDDNDIFCKKITRMMMTDPLLKNGMVDKTTGSVHRPKILTKDLYETLKKFIPDNHLNVEESIVKIKQINVKISLMSDKELFGRNNPSQVKLKQREKAIKLGFFLNLDGKMSPDVWISMLTK
jgi:hypothetical protein